MRVSLFFFLISLSLYSCNPAEPKLSSPAVAEDSLATENYFPVTTFIKGKIYVIKTELSNPVKVITTGGKSDTSWVKMEDLETELAQFLTPLIDTSNLKHIYKQSSFLDESISRFTFTYDLRNPTDTFSLRTWTVYADKETANVANLTMEKILPGNQKLLLSFYPDYYAKEILIKNDSVIREQTITWNQAKDE